MPASDVRAPLPLTRLSPWYPSQFGVPLTGADTGLRHSCEGTVFYVDPNNSDANDSRDGTEPTAPLATVDAAIGKCEAYKGDVILVMANNAGPYNDADEGRATSVNESVVVDVPGISIVGVSPSPMGVYWYVPDDGIGLDVRVTDVVIEGFAFFGYDGTETGIYVNYEDYYGDNVTIRHCHFDEDLDAGIVLDYSWYADIHDCMFNYCTHGIQNVSAHSDSEYARIYRNWFNECGTCAMDLEEAEHMFISGNWIYRQNKALNSFINLQNGSNNLVSQNVLACDLADYPTVCKDGANDAWCHNYCNDGVTTGNP